MSNTALDNSSTSVGHKRFQSAKVRTPLMAKTKNKRVQSLGEPTNELMYCRTATTRDALSFTNCITGG